MSCWKLRVANTDAARRLRGSQPGILERDFHAHSPTRESGSAASLRKRRIYELRRDRTWKHWRSDYQEIRRCGLSSENGKFTRPRVTKRPRSENGGDTSFS